MEIHGGIYEKGVEIAIIGNAGDYITDYRKYSCSGGRYERRREHTLQGEVGGRRRRVDVG